VVSGGAQIRVLVVDDDPDFVEAVTAMLETDRRVKVVGAASTGEEALRRVSELEPSVVAIDVVMPGMSGIEAARAIKASTPGCGVILLSGSIFQDLGEDARRLAEQVGASRYVLKSRLPIDLVDAVLEVAQAD
jgi:DNA-binding NarL/FixJ family response regulator